MDCKLFWEITLSILSFLLSLISICIAIATVRQNNKMIEETTRPNLSLIILNEDGGVEFYVKNNGASDAIIESVKHNIDFEFCNHHGYYPFKNCEGAVIPPGQCLYYVVDHDEFCIKNKNEISMQIEYKSSYGKKYELNQTYSIKALMYQSYMERTVTAKNCDIIQAKSAQRISKLLRTRL